MCFEAPPGTTLQLPNVFVFEDGGFMNETTHLEGENATVWQDFFSQKLDLTQVEDAKHLHYIDPSFTGPLGLVFLFARERSGVRLFQVKKGLVFIGTDEWG